MVDLSSYPTHVREAIQQMDLTAHARARVAEGVAWFDLNAPPDWRLQMMSIHDGKIWSHVCTCRDTENALALAFQRVEKYKRVDGRVSWASVNEVLEEASPSMRDAIGKKLGFLEMEHRVDNVIIDEMTDSKFLDWAWAEALGNYRAMSQPAKAYAQAA